LISTAANGLSIVVNYANVVPNGTSIGAITVQSFSAAGCASAVRSLNLPTELPRSPGTISITANSAAVSPTYLGKYVGTATPVRFSFNSVAGASSYIWEVPQGVQIVSGQGTTAIVVSFENFSNAPGNFTISAKTVAGCGVSTSRNIVLTKQVPAVPASLTASLYNVCLVIGTNTNVTYTIPAVPDTNSYLWTVPSGASIIGASNGTSITVNYASLTTNGTVTAKAVNAIGASAARVRTVQRSVPVPPSSLSGQRYAICAGNTYNYNFAAAEATSYLISAPAGSIVRSANFPSNTLNVLSTTETSFSVVFPQGYVSGSGLVQVFSVTACSTSATSKGLTIFTTPERPATVSGPTML
jgi:hypothetical protein